VARRRRRGSGGHPAKVAARREREQRHQQPQGSHAGSGDHDRDLADSLIKTAAGLGSAFEAETFVSEILGSIWSERERIDPFAEHEELELELGIPLIDALAEHSQPEARGLLAAFGFLGGAVFGAMAIERHDELAREGVDQPGWAVQLGRSKPVRTVIAREEVFDDGSTVWVESEYPDGDRIAVGVFIDHNLGCAAKDIALADSIDQVIELLNRSREQIDAFEPEILFEEVDVADAAARILEAMAHTDSFAEAPVSEEYPLFRALAKERVVEIDLSKQEQAPRPEVDPEIREQLLADFLSSEEASDASIEAGDDGAEAVSLAIDFASDYVDGRPLRWSPVVVELFMEDWFPRKITFAEELEPALPSALAAWIRFAGRRRGIPEEAIEQTLDSIDPSTEPMREAIAADDLSPATMLIRAAEEAGVDLTDQVALDNFIAGWNARSLEG
jgi:hypothetical protein